MSDAKILLRKKADLGLPIINKEGPTYVPPSKGGGMAEIYRRTPLPKGFEQVVVGKPSDKYIAATLAGKIEPVLLSAANQLLGRRISDKLGYNYAETFFILKNGMVTEHLCIVTLHFDNHPKSTSSPGHPPYHHSGVSIFNKLSPPIPLEEFEKKIDNKISEVKKEEKPQVALSEEEIVKSYFDKKISLDDLKKLLNKEISVEDLKKKIALTDKQIVDELAQAKQKLDQEVAAKKTAFLIYQLTKTSKK